MKIKIFFLLSFLLISEGLSAQNIIDKQVLFYDFDDNVLDQFGKTHTLTTEQLNYVECRKGGNTKSLSIKKEGASFEIYDSTFLNLKYYQNIALSFWLKVADKGEITRFSNDSTISNGGWKLSIDNNNHLNINIMPNAKGKQQLNLTSKQPVDLGRWIHYSIYFEKNKAVTFYINGEKDTSLILKKPLQFDLINHLSIGGKTIRSKTALEIDDLRLFDGAVNSDDAKKIFKLGTSSSQIEFDLGKPKSAKNSCTLQFELSPDGEKVLIENKGSKNTEGFAFRFYDNKLNLLTETPGNQKNYELNYSTFNRQPVFFLAVNDPKGFVVQIYQIHLTY